MKTVTIHDAKTNLSKYIAAAKRGETIYVGSFGKPEIEIRPLPQEKKSKRKLGMLKGKMLVKDDAFSRKTDEEIAKIMYGE